MGHKRWVAIFLVVIFLLGILVTPISSAPSQKPEMVEVLIGFHGPPNLNLVRSLGGETYREFDIVNAVAVRLPKQAIAAIQKNPTVRYIEEDGQAFALGTSTLEFNTVPWWTKRVFAGENQYPFLTWNSSTGKNVKVAVLDTGIDMNHPDLASKVKGGVNYLDSNREDWGRDHNSHGTHIAGIIAAKDTGRIVGVAPDVDLYDVRVLDTAGIGSLSNVVAGIDWAVRNNIDILSMSLGFLSSYQTLQDACNNAYQKGHLLVAAAGNSGDWGFINSIVYPARYSSVIAVAASNEANKRASFSSTGAQIELIAPGDGILSAQPGGGYREGSGTSMATPHVSGVAALVWAANPNLSNVEVRNILRNTTEDLKLSSRHQGYGLVRADLAVAAVAPPVPQTYQLTIEIDPTNGGRVTLDPTGNTYGAGTVINIEATPEEGYRFVNWTTSAGAFGNANSAETTFTMPARDVTITAHFEAVIEEPIVYNLSLEVNPPGAGTVTGAGPYEAGDIVVMIAEANGGYVFVNWKEGDTVISSQAIFSYAMPARDVTITAHFEAVVVEPPIEQRVVSVSIGDSTSGGKDNNRHLTITVTALDNHNNRISGAFVSLEILLSGKIYGSPSGTTGSNGTVSFSYNNYPAGTYTIKVLDVIAEGLDWDQNPSQITHVK